MHGAVIVVTGYARYRYRSSNFRFIEVFVQPCRGGPTCPPGDFVKQNHIAVGDIPFGNPEIANNFRRAGMEARPYSGIRRYSINRNFRIILDCGERIATTSLRTGLAMTCKVRKLLQLSHYHVIARSEATWQSVPRNARHCIGRQANLKHLAKPEFAEQFPTLN